MRTRLILIVVIAFAIGAVGAVLLRNVETTGVIQSGKALIGGPFTLTNTKGKVVTDQDFRGKFMLVMFGYTYCPDICPTELNVISETMNKLGSKADDIVPIFITVDPARDDVAKMTDYMSSFSPRLVGLTGTDEQIKQAASAYRVYYAKSEDGSSDGSYLMDHSTFIYLMSPQGEYVTHFGYGISADDLAQRIGDAMSQPSS